MQLARSKGVFTTCPQKTPCGRPAQPGGARHAHSLVPGPLRPENVRWVCVRASGQTGDRMCSLKRSGRCFPPLVYPHRVSVVRHPHPARTAEPWQRQRGPAAHLCPGRQDSSARPPPGGAQPLPSSSRPLSSLRAPCSTSPWFASTRASSATRPATARPPSRSCTAA